MEKPPQEPAPPPRPRGDVHVRVQQNRCPYCHDDVRAEVSVVCQACLGRHHAACWDEAGRCSSCGAAERLEPRPPPAPPCAHTGCDAPGTWTLGVGEVAFCQAHARTRDRIARWLTSAAALVAASSVFWNDLAPTSLSGYLLALLFFAIFTAAGLWLRARPARLRGDAG